MKRALYIGLTILGVIVAAVLVVMAYRGPTEAVRPSADYSRTNLPAAQQPATGNGTTPEPVSTAIPVTTATAPAVAGDSTTDSASAFPDDAAPSSNTAAPAAVSASQSSEIAKTKSANSQPAKRGALQAIIDVVSNLQL